jgi:protein-tyrosine phosphatase
MLCLCSGNYCRSPMAEGLLRRHLAQRYDGQFRVTSAGTQFDFDGQPPAPLVLHVVRERGDPGFTHQPHRVTAGEVAQADLILAMADIHRDWIAANYPDALPRTLLLAEAIGHVFGIPDPGVHALDPLRQTADLIEYCVRAGLDVIAARAMRTETSEVSETPDV